MTQRQRESAAKYLYDLSKIIFAAAVVGNLLTARNPNVLVLLIGGGLSCLSFWWGHVLDGIKE